MTVIPHSKLNFGEEVFKSMLQKTILGNIKINQNKIDDILSIYKPEHIYLKSAEIYGDEIKGIFRKSEYPYAREDFPYINAIRATLYLCQLTYIFAALLIEKRIYDITKDIDLDRFKEIRNQLQMYFTGINIKFRKKVDNIDNIPITMKLLSRRRVKEKIFCKLGFNINDSIFGELRAVMVL